MRMKRSPGLNPKAPKGDCDGGAQVLGQGSPENYKDHNFWHLWMFSRLSYFSENQWLTVFSFSKEIS